MKIKMTALELIMRLADGSTTANTLQHISKIAKATLNEMREREEMQPFIDMTNESYLRGVHDGRVAAQRQWVGLDNSERLSIWEKAMFEDNGKNASLQNQPFVHYAQAIEAKLKEKNGM